MATSTWQTSLAGYNGSSYLSALPDTDLRFATPYITTNPELRYTINFTTTGVYTLWLGGYAPNGAGDSVYVGMDEQSTTTMTGFTPQGWSWTNSNNEGDPVTVEVVEPGLYTLRIWQREDGLRLDRIILTTNSSYNPIADNPVESERISYNAP